MRALSIRPALRAICLAVATLAALGSVALAQPIDPPPACASGVTMMTHRLYNLGSGAIGRNLANVDFVTSINAAPGNLVNNGFHRICRKMGFNPGTPTDVDGDAITDDAALIQYDGKDGLVKSYLCSQPLASSAWTPGQGVEIQPNLSSDPYIDATFPPANFCTQSYPAYVLSGVGAQGLQLAPIPTGGLSATPEDLCQQLNLPSSPFPSVVKTIDAQFGLIETHQCGSLPLVTLRPGESAFIEASSNGNPPGTPSNCASGTCSTTPWPPPANEYPCLLLFPGTVPTFCP